MKTRKWILGLALAVMPCVLSADIILVYENAESLKAGKFQTAAVVRDGIVVKADWALANSQTMMMGTVGQDITKASLNRLDNDLGLAILKPGDPVFDKDLMEAHRKNSARVSAFIPADAVTALTSAAQAGTIAGVVPENSSQPFLLRINGQIATIDTIVIPMKRKLAHFSLDIVRPNAKKVWGVTLTLTAEPSLSFWNANKQTSLNDVPTKKFKWNTQSLFQPLAEGRFVTVPIDVHFIKQDEYTFHFKVEAKGEKFEQDVKIKFEEEKK